MPLTKIHLPKLKSIHPEQINRHLVEQLVAARKVIADRSWWQISQSRGCTLLAARTCVDNDKAILVLFRMTLRPQKTGRYEFGLHLGPERIFAIDVGREHRPHGPIHEHRWAGPGNLKDTATAPYITEPENHRLAFTQALARLNIIYEGDYPFEVVTHQRRLDERGISDELRDLGRSRS